MRGHHKNSTKHKVFIVLIVFDSQTPRMNSICCMYDVVPCAHTISFTFHLSVAMQKSTKSKNEHVVIHWKRNGSIINVNIMVSVQAQAEDVVVYWLRTSCELRKHKHTGFEQEERNGKKMKKNGETHTHMHTAYEKNTRVQSNPRNPLQRCVVTPFSVFLSFSLVKLSTNNIIPNLCSWIATTV